MWIDGRVAGVAASIAVALAVPPLCWSARADDLSDRLDMIEEYLEIEAAQRAHDLAVARQNLEQRHPAPLAEQKSSHQDGPSFTPFPDQPSATVQSAQATPPVAMQLDAMPDLARRWREMNVDPQFLAWLQKPDILSGQRRQTLLTQAYNAGDTSRVAAFFRTYIELTTPRAPSYTYIPTEQDRAEVQACVASAGPQTTLIDCAMPTLNLITSSMMQETGGSDWPAHPSQMTVMLQSAGVRCGMPADKPQAPTPPWAKPCLDAEARKISEAVVLGIATFIADLSK